MFLLSHCPSRCPVPTAKASYWPSVVLSSVVEPCRHCTHWQRFFVIAELLVCISCFCEFLLCSQMTEWNACHFCRDFTFVAKSEKFTSKFIVISLLPGTFTQWSKMGFSFHHIGTMHCTYVKFGMGVDLCILAKFKLYRCTNVGLKPLKLSKFGILSIKLPWQQITGTIIMKFSDFMFIYTL